MKNFTFYSMLFAVGLILGTNQSFAQTTEATQTPMIFKIGDQEDAYEELLISYSSSLLEVCNHEPMKAYENWLRLSLEMELFAQKTGFEIRGVKAWFHIFFGPDGGIDHLGYHLKPESRFVKQEELENFFKSFVAQYNFPGAPGKKFANYSAVEFPVVYSN